jgi:hypothetical protein
MFSLKELEMEMYFEKRKRSSKKVFGEWNCSAERRSAAFK